MLLSFFSLKLSAFNYQIISQLIFVNLHVNRDERKPRKKCFFELADSKRLKEAARGSQTFQR